MTLTIDRQGKRWEQTYTHGVPDAPLKVVSDSDRHGTLLRFWPSAETFTEYPSFTTKFWPSACAS